MYWGLLLPWYWEKSGQTRNPKDINIINCKMLYFWNYPNNLFDQQTQRAVPLTSHYEWRKWQSRYCPIRCHGLINKQQIRSLSCVGDSIKCHVGWGATTSTMRGWEQQNVISTKLTNNVSRTKFWNHVFYCQMNQHNLCFEHWMSVEIEYLSKVCSECWQCDKSKPKPTHIQHSVIWCHTLPYSYSSEHQIFIQWHMHRHCWLKELIVTSC